MSKAERRSADLAQANLDKSIQFLYETQAELRERHEKLRDLHTELRRSQLRYRDLFDAAPIGYVTADLKGRIVEANQAATELVGATAAALRGRSFEHLIAPQDRARFWQQLRRCRRDRTSPSLDTQIRRISGAYFPAQIVLLCSRNPDRDSPEFRIVIIDLTELKTVEQELATAKKDLEKRVEERTRQLQKSNRELSEQMVRSTRLESRLLEVSERERRRFGQDLHDETCQSLTGLAMQVAVLFQRLQKKGVEIDPQFRNLAVNLNDLVNSTRRIAHGLHPVSLGDGLVSALHELAATVADKFPCEVRANSISALPPEVTLALYRIAQEALNNTVKHAHASRAIIRLHQNTIRLTLSIEDDGVGLLQDIPPRPGSMGLDILGYRARSIGGQIIVENLPKRGVRVMCHLPSKALEAAV